MGIRQACDNTNLYSDFPLLKIDDVIIRETGERHNDALFDSSQFQS